MKHEFLDLPYAYDSLEPIIDKETMILHHDKHHKAYYDKFVAAISGTDAENQSLEEIFANISKHSKAVRNNGGGFYNHTLFWNCMSPNGGGNPKGDVAEAIKRDFGNFENLKTKFSEAAVTQFGSGWAWLYVKDGKLFVSNSSNQDNPLMDILEERGEPILALDVWEHAYYLRYQNKRPDYVNAWWNVVNWDYVEKRLHQANNMV